jgi:hypothetical protein
MWLMVWTSGHISAPDFPFEIKDKSAKAKSRAEGGPQLGSSMIGKVLEESRSKPFSSEFLSNLSDQGSV